MTTSDIVVSFNILGALFRLDPADPKLHTVLVGLQNGDVAANWPWRGESINAALAEMAQFATDNTASRAALHSAFLDLFIGPEPLPAPPWGSVYLDEEKVLFGASTSALVAFLALNAVAVGTTDNGPTDHFGTVCWIAAWLASQGRMEAFDELMGVHVLPWAFFYLDEFGKAARALAENNSTAAFYAAAASVAAETLGAVKAERRITTVVKKLYGSRAI